MNYADDFLTYLTSERGYSEKMIMAYSHDLESFSVFLGEYEPDMAQEPAKIDRQAIRHFLGHLQERGLSPRTQARHLATLKSYFKYLHRCEVIASNPAAVIRTPKTGRSLPEFLDLDQIAKLMEAPPENTLRGLRDRAIMETFYSSGLRLAELAGLRVGDISFNAGTVRVVGKGNKERIVPLGREAAKALGRYLEARRGQGELVNSDSPLFCGRGTKPIARRTIQLRVNHYLREVAEARHLSPHLLRHTVATHMLDKGADLMAVKDFLGHSSLSTTQIYTHIKVDQMKKAYSQAHPHGDFKKG